MDLSESDEETKKTAPEEITRLEFRFTISDLEELKEAFQVKKKSKGFELSKYEFASFVSSFVNKGEKYEVILLILVR